MTLTRLSLSVLLLAMLSSCSKQAVEVPAYLYLDSPRLLAKADKSQGYPSGIVENYYLFSVGDFRGLYGLGARVPLQLSSPTQIRVTPAVRYNGMADQWVAYPFFADFDTTIAFKPEQVDTLRPTFRYLENTAFPLIEDYDGSGLTFEYNTQYKQVGDTLVRDNSAGAWKPGDYSGRVQLNSGVAGSFLELYSKVYSNWPMFTPIYLELDYKSNIPVVVGLYASNSNGDVSKFPMYVLNPKEDWNRLYLDMQPEINKRGAGMQYRVYLSFDRGEVSNPSAWIDNIKVVHLD